MSNIIDDLFSEYDNKLLPVVSNPEGCCDNPNWVENICTNCYSIINKVVFENDIELTSKMSYKVRSNKFREFIFNKPINNFCRNTLIDIFPKIEHQFFESDRKNFVNLNQLVRELLPLIGYDHYVYLFPPLKTKSRCLQIKKLVNESFKGGVEGVGKRLEDMEYLEPKCRDIDMSKAVKDHTFSDRNNINAKTLSEGKTKTQTKGKEGSQKVKINLKRRV